MRVKPVAATTTTAMVIFLLATPATAQMDGTAADVVDRDSLMQFVQRAKTAVDQAASDAACTYDFADMAFRPQGDWNQGSIYIFILKTNGVVFFHGARMDLEGVSFWDRSDRNGVLYAQALIRAAEAGDGFVEYVFDNPDVMGDEEAGSPNQGGLRRSADFRGRKSRHRFRLLSRDAHSVRAADRLRGAHAVAHRSRLAPPQVYVVSLAMLRLLSVSRSHREASTCTCTPAPASRCAPAGTLAPLSQTVT